MEKISSQYNVESSKVSTKNACANEPGRNTKCTQSGEKNITSKFYVVAAAPAERENLIVTEISFTKEESSGWTEGNEGKGILRARLHPV